MTSDSKKDKRGLMMMLVAILLLTLIGAGIGFAVGLVLQKPSQTDAEKPAEAAKPAEHAGEEKPKSTTAHDGGEASSAEAPSEPEQAVEDIPLKDLRVIPFPPILTTLAEPKGKWIRLEGALLALPSTEKAPELLAEETGEQILSYLRTLRLADIETPSGFLGLRDDLNETVKVMSDGQVRGILIHGLIVE